MEDDSGQFLLLTSVVVALGLVILLVFINQSSMSGYSSSESIMNFPKDNIRDFRTETINEAQYIASAENSYNKTGNGSQIDGLGRKIGFNTNFTLSINDIKQIYAQRGIVVDVQSNTAYNDQTTDPKAQMLINTTLKMTYNDGETSYYETYVVDFG